MVDRKVHIIVSAHERGLGASSDATLKEDLIGFAKTKATPLLSSHRGFSPVNQALHEPKRRRRGVLIVTPRSGDEFLKTMVHRG